MTRGARRHSRGMSLLEMVVAMVIFASVIGAVMAGMTNAFGVYRGTVSTLDIDRRANAALDDIAAELADAPAGAVTTDFDANAHTSSITYRVQSGWSGGAAVLRPTTTIAWISDQMDADDGVDNDNDGLVDEGTVTRTVDGEGSVILATNVAKFLEGETADSTDENGNGLADESGLAFSMEDGALAIRLTLQKVGADGELVTKTVETAIQLRN